MKKARAAIETFDDSIDRMFMSGTRVTFTLKKDAKIDKDAVEKAVKKKGLKFVSLEAHESERALAAYVAKTPGLT